jgi:hypothetical protein
MRFYEGLITELKNNQIFVFGANKSGRHGKGTALTAINKFGAIYGQSSGLQGNSWAITTTDLTKRYRPSVSKSLVVSEIKKLYDYALENEDFEFLIAYTGITNKNLSGFTNDEFAEMFSVYPIPENIVFEKDFYTLVFKNSS